MTPEQQTYTKDAIEALAKRTLQLLKDIDSVIEFVGDVGGFGQDTTIPVTHQNAYSALATISDLLNNIDVPTGFYRQPLNQTQNSPQ